MSPWGKISERTIRTDWGDESVRYNIAGVQQLDYMELFKKFTVLSMGAQESYKLDFIAEAVLGTKKLDYSHIGDGSLRDLYEKDFNIFLAYNIIDVELLVKMDEKLALMDLVFSMAYTGGVNYVDTLGTVGIWDSLICRYLHAQHIAVPPETSHQSEAYGGGYVKEVRPGKYEWIMSFDLASLYPNIIIQHNTSPETLVVSSTVNPNSASILSASLRNHLVTLSELCASLKRIFAVALQSAGITLLAGLPVSTVVIASVDASKCAVP